jgi:hypothetical protein
MDIGIIAAIIMLVLWLVAVVAWNPPGWIHVLLTFGIFLLMWRIVVRGTPGVDVNPKKK